MDEFIIESHYPVFYRLGKCRQAKTFGNNFSTLCTNIEKRLYVLDNELKNTDKRKIHIS